jgi:hypothetical protein
MGILWDEPGVEAGAKARTAMSYQNRAIADVVETCRERNLVTAYALPSKSMIDKNIRVLFHASVTMREPGVGKFYLQVFDPQTGTIYNKTPSVWLNNNILVKKPEITFKLPPKELYYEYKKMKREYTNAWYAHYSDRLDSNKVVPLEKSASERMKEMRDAIQNSWENYWLPSSNAVDLALIGIDFPGITSRESHFLKLIIKEKGKKQADLIK